MLRNNSAVLKGLIGDIFRMTGLLNEVDCEDRGRLFTRVAKPIEARAKAGSKVEEEGLCSNHQTSAALRNPFFGRVQE